ncbi:MAG: MBL fold metallo-hydrolase, partial [Candidatus Marsarchaeota archaeon]|nr:MBL fold metallo-hydrolase [Candidatus Marsarchaeota archaeon]
EHGSDMDFISHAHSDHISAARSSKEVIASAETVQLLRVAKKINVNACQKKISGIRLLDSGHMLGSKQIRIEHAGGQTVTYTGDFTLQEHFTCKPIEILETETLIMDSTYSSPEIKFDSKKEVEDAIELWSSRKVNQGIVLFGVHAMGKAQEVTKILNNAGIVPFVTDKIASISSVYQLNEVDLDYAAGLGGDGTAGETGGNFVGIVESHRLDEMAMALAKSTGKRVFRATATGFAKMFRFNTDVQFPLSDHADFRQSIRYIEAANPQKIFTYGSNSEAFARNLNKAGYNAEPFRTEVAKDYSIIEGVRH